MFTSEEKKETVSIEVFRNKARALGTFRRKVSYQRMIMLNLAEGDRDLVILIE